MKQRLTSALIYANAALALGFYFDGLYGGEPIRGSPWLMYAATAGTVLFVVACVLSAFNFRLGSLCGTAASVASWPYCSVLLATIPWGVNPVSLLPHARWGDEFAALLALAAASIHAMIALRSSWTSKSMRGLGIAADLITSPLLLLLGALLLLTGTRFLMPPDPTSACLNVVWAAGLIVSSTLWLVGTVRGIVRGTATDLRA